MSTFGGLVLTNRGKNLQSKAQTGVQLEFTRIGAGDGNLGSTSILALNALINQVVSLSINKLKALGDGRAVVGTSLTNQDLTEGFYFREIGLFATDPDLGEILYCYGNAGNLAEYVSPGGGTDIIEKGIDIQTVIGNAQNISAVINESLVYATLEDLNNIEVPVTSVNTKTGDVVLNAADVGAETPSGAQSKATAAETSAKGYTDNHAAIDATTTAKGHVELATTAEATTGTDTTRAVTPAGLKAALAALIAAAPSTLDTLDELAAALGDDPNFATTITNLIGNHTGNKSNPHAVTKAQVGLGSLLDYGIATQAEAQAGTSNVKYMTPLRVKEAIAKLSSAVLISTINTSSIATKIDINIPTNFVKVLVLYDFNSSVTNGNIIYLGLNDDTGSNIKSIKIDNTSYTYNKLPIGHQYTDCYYYGVLEFNMTTDKTNFTVNSRAYSGSGQNFIFPSCMYQVARVSKISLEGNFAVGTKVHVYGF